MSKSIDSNKQFMIGNGLLAFGVFFIVFLFLYLGFRSQRKEGQAEAFSDKYILTSTTAWPETACLSISTTACC